MCGIAGVHIKPNARGKIAVGHLIDNLLIGIEPRGKDATGFMAVSFDNEILLCKQDIPAREFTRKRKSIKNNSQTVILHTRWATQGHQSFMENNHPVQYGTMFVTHNGHVWNDRELFEDNDWERNAEVDTVAIPALLWDTCDGNFKNAGKALEQIDGMMSMAAIDVKQPGTVLVARGYSSPLVMIETKDMIIWASTKEAIKHAWSKVLGTPPADNKFVTVKEGELFLIVNGEMKKETFEYKVMDYNYGYTGGRSFTSSAMVDDDWRWGSRDDYSYPSQRRSNSKRGYWVTDKGVRRYVEMNPTLKTDSAVAVTAKDLEAAEEYTEWAEADVQMNREAFEIVGAEWDLPAALVEWIILYAPDNVLDGDVKMSVVHNALKEAYLITYDDLCMKYSVPKSQEKAPTHKTQMHSQWECVDCGDPTDNVYRCNLCMVENVDNPILKDYRSAMERDSDTLLLGSGNEA
jgi:predicted glutamine amidotransferase